MPGLVGVAGEIRTEQAVELVANMARALESEPRFRTEIGSAPGMALGRVSLGLVNPETQPIWNAERSRCVVMEGELYGTQELRRALTKRGRHLTSDGHAELVLHLYEEYGRGFVELLNGAFVVAIWDETAQELVLTNDHLGLYPLYYTRHDGYLAFASGVRALLADPALEREVDLVAINEFLTFDHLLGEQTLLRSVHLLPQASVLTFRDGMMQLVKYWEPKPLPVYPLRPEEEYVDALLHHLQQSASRMSYDNLPAGLLLSGGLDSRMLLPLLAHQNGRRFGSFTWGIPGCDDARYAKELASLLDVPHHFYELKPDYLLRTAEESVRLTDGMANIVNLHSLATLEPESREASILYKGFMGDAMFGVGLRNMHWADYGDDRLYDAHLATYLDKGVLTFTPTEQQSLLTPAFRLEVCDVMPEIYEDVALRSGTRSMASQRIYIDLTQRVPRMTLNGVEVMRNRVTVRLPYCDKDLVSFALTLPPGMLFERHLFKRAFIKAFPGLAKVPYSETGLPMLNCVRDVRMRAAHLARWHMRKAGLTRVGDGSWRPYKDYANWFRRPLRAWIEGILLDERSLKRGYFDPSVVRKLVGDHMSGANHTVKLGALLSIELWHRRFLD